MKHPFVINNDHDISTMSTQHWGIPDLLGLLTFISLKQVVKHRLRLDRVALDLVGF